MTRTVVNLFTTLIRTHHITSRKKLQKVKKAASHHALPFVLIRSGGSPGIMYAESSDESSLSSWVNIVQGLRYKDYQCARKPTSCPVQVSQPAGDVGFIEVTSVAQFGEKMEQRGLEKIELCRLSNNRTSCKLLQVMIQYDARAGPVEKDLGNSAATAVPFTISRSGLDQ
ncbi:hypothetical protein F4810DRAFT_706235 [Camillea tinctor]|nr:hypothetical protein F4810DRAFT_706235 [Camillea tinctor]